MEEKYGKGWQESQPSPPEVAYIGMVWDYYWQEVLPLLYAFRDEQSAKEWWEEEGELHPHEGAGEKENEDEDEVYGLYWNAWPEKVELDWKLLGKFGEQEIVSCRVRKEEDTDDTIDIVVRAVKLR